MNSGRIDGLSRFVDAASGDQAVARDFCKGQKYEGSFEQSWMGQGQVRLVQGQVVIGDDIYIDGARAVPFFMAPITAKPSFYLLRASKQLAWAKCCLDCDGKIDEMRLIFETPWWRPIVG